MTESQRKDLWSAIEDDERILEEKKHRIGTYSQNRMNLRRKYHDDQFR